MDQKLKLLWVPRRSFSRGKAPGAWSWSLTSI